MSLKTLRTELGSYSYDILIGDGILADAAPHILPVLKQKRVIIVSDAHVAPLYQDKITASLTSAGVACETITLPAGESSKSFLTLEWLMDSLLELQPERKTTLIALGGGVIGDITGFAASILLRGVPFIQIPTTLLAQVDSSVGGKTGINTHKGKNLVGSFYQPQRVLIDTSVLKTLPEREMKSGYAEIVKYGLINQPDFFAWLVANGSKLLSQDTDALAHAIHVSCASKAEIVSKDEKESGIRALLNLGHTFAHALEAETGFGHVLLHGEAVAIGMVMAFTVSVRMGMCPQSDLDVIVAHYKTVGLHTSPLDVRADWNIDALIHHFHQDKKVMDGKLTFILARGIGKSFVTQEVEVNLLRKVLAEILKIP
jgi:3-dehydroquinate synthase